MPERVEAKSAVLSKVPQVTFAFWVVKILATTLGETGGDALSMSLHLGYLVSTFIFLGFFVATLAAQLATAPLRCSRLLGSGCSDHDRRHHHF